MILTILQSIINSYSTGYRFQVGDGKMYNGVPNVPLEKGSGYDVYYGVDVQIEVGFISWEKKYDESLNQIIKVSNKTGKRVEVLAL